MIRSAITEPVLAPGRISSGPNIKAHGISLPGRAAPPARDSSFVIAAALFAPLLTSAPARAALSVSPVVHEVVLDSNTSSSGRWTVRNISSRPLDISLQAVPYVDYVRGRRNAPPPAWLQFTPGNLHIEPGCETQVSFMAFLPDQLEGETMAFVFFQEEGGGMVQGRIGTAFYVMCRGTLQPAISLATLRLVDDGRGGKRFFLEFANSGNVHLRPSGVINLLDSSGSVVSSARLPAGMPVLPGANERFVTDSLKLVPESGEYRARWTLATEPIDGATGPVLEGERLLQIE